MNKVTIARTLKRVPRKEFQWMKAFALLLLVAFALLCYAMVQGNLKALREIHEVRSRVSH